MTMAKKLQTRLNIHDALQHGSYDHTVICTYTFEPNFFEDYALEKFDTLSNNANITVIVDRRQYERTILGPEHRGRSRPTYATYCTRSHFPALFTRN